jgi:hypothetical protein
VSFLSGTLLELVPIAPSMFTRGQVTALLQAQADQGDLSGAVPIAQFFFPEIAPYVAAFNVAASGRISPEQLFNVGGAMNGSPDFPWSGDSGDFEADFPAVNVPEVGWETGSWGGPDINLGTVGDIIGDLAGGQAAGAGGMMTVGAPGVAAAAAAGAGLALRMPQIVAGAILKLKQALGGGGFLTAGGIASFGARTWSALTSWAARNPGLSVISTLVGLGLTVEEAAHFLAWGATKRRRRHRRGITYRDMRTTKRTMGRVISMSQQLRSLCGAVPHRSYSHRHRVINVPRRR